MMLKNTSNKLNFTLNCNGKLIYVDKPIVMGIINCTPDSFYADSSIQETDALLHKARQMVADGAAIIDIGAQSTRPGSTYLSWQEEWERLAIPLQEIRKALPTTILSVDTFHSAIAEKAVNMGVDIINDISGGTMDAAMLTTVGRLNVPYICMHIQGTPTTMQQNPVYESVVKTVLDYFIERKIACVAAGIKDIIIDPGFGFGKTIEHNYTLLNQLATFSSILELPLLVGLSRKSMIYKLLSVTAAESLNGTTALNMLALQKGAAILRVHDVKEAVQVVQLWQQVQHSSV
jgi:dihydropteroate synthase